MANKKINQLVSKTAILSTDIFGIGDATTGQLFKKTIAELQAAIGGAVISVNGLVGTVVLDTDDIQELATPTNKYFTDARARGAISLTVTGNSGASTYSSGTGVLNVPTYTLAGLGGITATFLTGGAGISYNSTTGVISYSGTVYTDASIRALLSGGTGISYNSTTGAISYSGTVYTDSSVRALISITTTGDSGASTYNNTTGVINVPNYTLAGLGGISYTSLSGGTGITYNNTTGAISYSGTVYTDASVRALLSAGTGISYNSTTGVITSTITQYTDALARASISITTTGTSGASTYNSTTGVLNVPQYQGAITLTTTGTSGAATFSSNTLNIPQYQAVLTNPVTGTGTSGYHAKWTSSSAIGNGILYDNGTNLGISNSNPFAGATSLIGMAISDRGGIFKLNVNNVIYLSNNLYYDGSDWRRITANGGTMAYLGSQDGGTFIIATTSTGTAGSNATITDRFTITSAGTVGIGVTPSSQNGGALAGSTEIGGILRIQGGAGRNFSTGNGLELSRFRIYSYNRDTSAYNDLDINDAMTVKGGTNILMGTTSDNGERLYVSGNIRATGSITANSDISLKKNLLKIENALEKVEQINGYTYELKEDDSKRHGGVIAQEMEKVFPEIVNTGNDGLMGVEYGNISALLIEAIKEQNTKIKNLETLLASK
jgi:hypothetical protein